MRSASLSLFRQKLFNLYLYAIALKKYIVFWRFRKGTLYPRALLSRYGKESRDNSDKSLSA
jgi:hypothetical protein